MSYFNAEHQKMAAAVATLESMKYTWNGSVHWRPPLGKKPDFDLIDNLQAKIDKLQAEVERLKSGRTRIPVDERSPIEDGRYVVQLTAVTDLGTSKYTDVAFWVGEWSIHDNEARVTHWIDENLDSGLVEGLSK